MMVSCKVGWADIVRFFFEPKGPCYHFPFDIATNIDEIAHYIKECARFTLKKG